jgi:predicted DNA-binding transcriptional regulator YafY
MPINKNAFKRYKVIDMLLRNRMRRFPTLAEITEICIEKLDLKDLSTETIRKDMEHMRESQPNGFEAPIKYHPTNRGYYYTDPDYSIDKISLSADDVDTLKESIDLIKSIGGSRVSEKFNNAIEKILSTVLEEFPEGDSKQVFLQTMLPPKSRGFEHFDLFYYACRKKIPVSIIHYNYQKRIFNSLTIHPILIKEFENKWYIIAYSENHSEVRTFGLDRIFDPLLLKKKFINVEKNVLEKATSSYYGVLPIANQEKQTIKISISDLVTNYFEAYPIHESQQISKEPNGFSIISFYLIPTMELTRLFLSYGKDIKIIEPSWLIDYTKTLN